VTKLFGIENKSFEFKNKSLHVLNKQFLIHLKMYFKSKGLIWNKSFSWTYIRDKTFLGF